MTPKEIDAVSSKHFLPETPADWGNLVDGLMEVIDVPVTKKVNDGRCGWVQVEWVHYNLDGPLTRGAFQEQVANAVANFGEQINQHGRFEPFKIRGEGKRAMGFESYDFKHRTADLRAICSFGTYRLPEHTIRANPELKSFQCPGLHFVIATLIQHDPEADEVNDDE
jgi:hypothetical protein